MTEHYTIKVTGQIRAGLRSEDVEARLVAQLKLPAATARQLVSGRSLTVKKNVDETFARRYVDMLEKAGLEARMEPLADSGEASTAPPTDARNDPGKDTADDRWQQQADGFRYRIQARPDYAFLDVDIPPGESLRVEASAMATMDTNLVMKTKIGGGLKRLVSGESIFLNEFTAEGGAGQIGIAPGSPGDLTHVWIDEGTGLVLQNSAFVASGTGVEVDAKWQGLAKGFFSGEGLFLIRAYGRGDLWFNTYGAMIEIDVDGQYVVDNHHIVAFSETLDYKIEKIGGYKSLFFSGEGLVCRFSGKGRLWLQTRKARALVSWAQFYRPVKQRG